MALTFPRGMPSKGIGGQRFELQRVDYLSPNLAGQVASVTAGFPLWSATWALTGMSEAQSQGWRAWVSSLRGSQKLFLGRDLLRSVPLAYKTTGLGAFNGDASSWSVNSDRDVLTLNGLPSGFVLSPGDYVGFRWGTDPVRRTMVGVLEAVTGTSISFSIDPPLPTIVPVTAVAHVKDPCCLMRLTPETDIGDMGVNRVLTGRISAIQTLIS